MVKVHSAQKADHLECVQTNKTLKRESQYYLI